MTNKKQKGGIIITKYIIWEYHYTYKCWEPLIEFKSLESAQDYLKRLQHNTSNRYFEIRQIKYSY